MKIYVSRLFVLSISFVWTSSVFALERGQDILLTDPVVTDSMMKMIENAVWATDGENGEKPVYILYGTRCGWSQKLFEDTRNAGKKIQLRWIPAEAETARHVVSERTAESVKEAFSDISVSVSDPRYSGQAVALNHSIMTNLAMDLRAYSNSKNFHYPTLVYRTNEGVRVISGNPSDLNRMMGEVVSQPEKAEFVPDGIRIAKADIKVQPAPKLNRYTNTGTSAETIYYFPDKAAPVYNILEPRVNLPVTGVVENDEWLEVAPSGKSDRQRAYIYSPLYAQLAQLDFTVRKASGKVSSKTVDLEVRSHPLSEAPILEMLPKGYEVSRTGEVVLDGKVWDEVRIYTDGTPGYIAR